MIIDEGIDEIGFCGVIVTIVPSSSKDMYTDVLISDDKKIGILIIS